MSVLFLVNMDAKFQVFNFQNDEETQKTNPRRLMQHQNSYRDVVLKLSGELGVGQEK